jgi:hypothetical protein
MPSTLSSQSSSEWFMDHLSPSIKYQMILMLFTQSVAKTLLRRSLKSIAAKTKGAMIQDRGTMLTKSCFRILKMNFQEGSKTVSLKKLRRDVWSHCLCILDRHLRWWWTRLWRKSARKLNNCS